MSPTRDTRRPGVRTRAIALRALLGAAALGASAAGLLWLGYGGALSLSLALALPATENWLPGTEVTREEVPIPFAGRMLAADLYRPAHRPARPRGVILLVHGLSPAGRRQPDLTRLGRLLARHGQLGLVPQFATLAAFTLDGPEIAAIGAALDRLSPLPVMSHLRGRALIAHGRADISIPYTESLRLARAAGAHAVILNTFHHTGSLSLLDLVGPGALDAWRLVGLADALLRAREP